MCMEKIKLNRMIVLLLWVSALCAGFSACNSDDEATIEGFTQGDMIFEKPAGEKAFTFTAHADWTLTVAATDEAEWCSVTPSSGTVGVQNVVLKVTENEGYDNRSVTITLKAPNYTKSFVVTQEGVNSSLLTFHVAIPGDLSKMVTVNYYTVENLALTGNLNGSDINTIQRFKNLAYLDLSGANLEGGGNYSHDFDGYNESHEAERDVVGTHFFWGLKNLKSVILPMSAVRIAEDALRIDEYIIDNEVQTYGAPINAVVLPKELTSIEYGAFAWCSSLTSIDIPAGVTNIDLYAFLGCSSLTSVNIPPGVTIIKFGVFQDCSSLRSVNIPAGVTSIWGCAFEGCNIAECWIYATTPPELESSAFDKNNNKLYVPKGTYNAYCSSAWGEYFDNIIEMEE